MLYWNEIINDLPKIITKYERISEKQFFFLSSTLLRKLCVHYANGFDNT
jgi:hypothetical protein